MSGYNWNTEFRTRKLHFLYWHLKSTYVLQYDHRKSMNEWKSSKNLTWGHIFLDWEEGRRATRSRCSHSPGWSRDLWAAGRDHDRSPPWPSSPPDHKQINVIALKSDKVKRILDIFLSTGCLTPLLLTNHLWSKKIIWINLFTWRRLNSSSTQNYSWYQIFQ